MRNKFKVLAMAFLSLGLIGLTGCRQNLENAEKASSVAIMKTAQNKQPQVWIQGSLTANAIHKNSEINDILVVKNGKVADYDSINIKFQDIKGKNTTQIIQLAKKNRIKVFKKYIAYQISTSKRLLAEEKARLKPELKNAKEDPVSQFQVDDTKKKIKEYTGYTNRLEHTNYKYRAPKSYPLKAKINTDDNDKNVTAEELTWKYDSDYFDTTTPNADPSKLVHKRWKTVDSMDLNGILGYPISILGEQYIGYFVHSTDSDSDYSEVKTFLITKTQNKKAKAEFDSVKTPNVQKTNESVIPSN